MTTTLTLLRRHTDEVTLELIREVAESLAPDHLLDSRKARMWDSLLAGADEVGRDQFIWALETAIEARQIELLDLVADKALAAAQRDAYQSWKTILAEQAALLEAEPDRLAAANAAARSAADRIGLSGVPVDGEFLPGPQMVERVTRAAYLGVPVTVSEVLDPSTILAIGEPLERLIVGTDVAALAGIPYTSRAATDDAQVRAFSAWRPRVNVRALGWALVGLALFLAGAVVGLTNPTPLNGRTIVAIILMSASVGPLVVAGAHRSHRDHDPR